MIEIWKDIKGFESDYQISNLGRAKSLKYGKERILKASHDGDGYLQVVLFSNKKANTRHIHKLVAIEFLNHVPDGLKIVVNHKDGNKQNNIVENLECVTNRLNTSIGKNQLDKTSKHVGVHWNKVHGKWCSQIYSSGKIRHIGVYENELVAANAYQEKLKAIINGN